MSYAQMESKLGYELNASNYPDEIMKRFYSNLRLVPDSIYERIMDEFDVCTSGNSKAFGASFAAIPLALGDTKVCRPALSPS